MTMKKNSEISKLTASEIAKTTLETREKLRAFRVAMAGSRVKNVREGRTLRRTIARLLTAARKGA